MASTGAVWADFVEPDEPEPDEPEPDFVESDEPELDFLESDELDVCPAFLEHTGQAPMPWLPLTFSATWICCSRLACSGWPVPPYACQVESVNWSPPPYPLPVLVFQLPLLSHWAMASQSVAEAVPTVSASGVAASAPTRVSWAARRVRARASDSSLLRSMTSHSHRAPPGTGRERRSPAGRRPVPRGLSTGHTHTGVPSPSCSRLPGPHLSCGVSRDRWAGGGRGGPGVVRAVFVTTDAERYGAQAGFQPGPDAGTITAFGAALGLSRPFSLLSASSGEVALDVTRM